MNAPRLEARRWFQEAQADLAVVRTLRDAEHHAAACFHSQQAAEKALKALCMPRVPVSCSDIQYVSWRARDTRREPPRVACSHRAATSMRGHWAR